MLSYQVVLGFFLSFALLFTPLHCAEHQEARPISDDSTQHPSEDPRQGWTQSPNIRGTIDIIWSCVFTMGLCSWSMLCLNLPAPKESRGRVLYRRIWLTALSLLGPEFIFQLALGQWLSARQSVADFRASGFEGWTMTHAFFADAGGFVLHPKDWVPFPLDAKQLHYLVINRYIRYPRISKRLIKDKNKVDGLLRLITLFQIIFFVFNVSARAAQGLIITCGELTTAAFIVCSLGTSICWAHKPADVIAPESIETIHVGIADILLQAGDQAKEPYSRTPLDFVSRKEWAWSLFWANWLNILRNMKIPFIDFVPKRRPLQRFEDSRSKEIPESKMWLLMSLSVAYSAIFISGWKYSFPTKIERTLWRIASVSVVVTVFSYWIVTFFAFSWWPSHREQYASKWHHFRHTSPVSHLSERHEYHDRSNTRLARIAASVRNNSMSRDPELTVPLKALLPVYVVAFVYCHARTYIFLEDIIELRSLPRSAFVTVNWAQFVPHFW